jgi:hypothetical protein
MLRTIATIVPNHSALKFNIASTEFRILWQHFITGGTNHQFHKIIMLETQQSIPEQEPAHLIHYKYWAVPTKTFLERVGRSFTG